MALATQCPHCHTTFRVAHDQLKLRAGLVRCGACKQIFNGIENLLRPEQLEQVAPSAPQSDAPEPAAPASTDELHNAAGGGADEATQPATQPAAPAAQEPEPTTSVREPEDPLLRMTLMDFTHDAPHGEDADADAPAQNPPQEPDALDSTIDDLQRKPWRRSEPADDQAERDALDQVDDAAYEEPSFVRQGRRRQRVGHVMRVMMAIGLPLLLIGLLAQGVYTFRDQLAAWFPQTKPMLAAACRPLRCQVGLPAQIESVSIESSELQALAPERNLFALSALLRNRGATVQAWPSIELTLNDADDKPVVRRVFIPRDYLPAPQDIDKGFAPTSEQPIRLAFELSQLKASGYRVYLFYP